MKFCIVGTGRCGTSFMQRLLNAHPDCYTFNETHALPTMYERVGMGAAPSASLLQMLLDTRFITGDCVLMNNATAAGFSEQAFLAQLEALVKRQPMMSLRECWDAIAGLLLEQSGKRYWGDKTPDYGAYMGLLEQLWPDVVFIHMVRNGVPTASSMMGHAGFNEMVKRGRDSWATLAVGSWQPGPARQREPTVHDFFALWARRLARVIDESTRLRNASYHEFRYEQLLSAPRETLESICAAIGLEPDAQWLDESVGQVDPGAVQKLAQLSYDEASLGSRDELALGLMRKYGYLPS